MTANPPRHLDRHWTCRWTSLITAGFLGWAGLGRVLFGIDGWYALFFILYSIPLLLIPTVQAILIHLRTERPRELNLAERICLVGVWVGLSGFGTFLVDGVGDEDDASVFTTVAGNSETVRNVGQIATEVSSWLVVAAWTSLFALLIGHLVHQASRKRTPPATPERPPPYRPDTHSG